MTNEVGGGKEGLIPIFERHRSMGEKCKPHLHNVVMFLLGCTVLLMCMRARHMMENSNGSKKGNQFFILPTPIELNGDDLATSHALNKLLKFKNEFRHFRLMTKKIDPSKFVIIINETYTVFFWPKESMAGPHTSE
jgi:hypothetical protein